MKDLTKKQKLILGILILWFGITTIFYFTRIYQTPSKTMEIYQQALNDYQEGNFQNAYYLFSKVSFFSNLKPVSIYRQAKSAEDIGDNDAAIKQYQLLFSNYPKHKLSLRSKYFAAKLLVDTNPILAQKYFNSIIETAPNTDYGIASGYFLGKILLNNQISNSEIPDSEKNIIRNYYREYLHKAPSGRWAINIVRDLTSNNFNLTTDDYLLLVKAAYLFGDFDTAHSLLFKIPLAKSWALDVKVSYALKNYSRVKYITEYGISQHASDAARDDLYDAVNLYLKVEPDNYKAVSKLYSYQPDAAKDFLLSLKCQNSSSSERNKCFTQLYNYYPNSTYSQNALASIFLYQLKTKDFATAKKTGQEYLNKFSSSSNSPMIMYWMGKIAERTNHRDEFVNYYRGVISKYPDTYYAYRAYLRLNNLSGPIISSYIHEKPVVYPYEKQDSNLNLKLSELKDYDMLFEINEDEFVKSWIYYQKGDYSHSMLIARDAMDKISNKPDKYDLRWRLVYPIDYYETIKKYSDIVGNNSPLILALVREESYFNPDARSVVGAAGLMQLMPATANEIGKIYGINFDTVSDLYNPDLNIKLGNYYYSQLKSMLNGMDVSSIAAYNGGIGSVNNWKKSLYYNDTDEFVEQIPYVETRDYVKKVFRSYWNYIRIYSGNE